MPSVKSGRRSAFRAFLALFGVLAVAGCALLPGSEAEEPAAGSSGPACPDEPPPVVVTGSWQPLILPLELSLDSTGDLDVALVADWVTPIGTFSVDAAANEPARAPEVHRLVIEHYKDGSQLRSVYDIKCDRAYRVFLDGVFSAKVTTNETVIEAEPGKQSTIVVVDADSEVDPDLRPLPSYQALKPDTMTLADPIAKYGYGVDLDAMEVGEFVAGSELDTDDADLRYEYSTGLTAGYHGFFGTTERSDPTPQQCRADAERNSAGDVAPDAIREGRLFCVVTSKGNVAHLALLQVSGPYPDRYTLRFRVRGWVDTESASGG